MKKLVSFLLILAMVFALVPSFSASDDIRYHHLVEDDAVNVDLHEYYPVEYFAFECERSGYYSIYSSGVEDTFVYCYDENKNQIGFDDDSGLKENFTYNTYMQKGQVMFFKVSAIRDSEYAMFHVCVTSLDNKTEMKLNTDYTIQPSIYDDREFFEFVPDESGYYAFYSTNRFDACAVLYDSNWKYVDQDIDSGKGTDFYLTCYLQKGETYNFLVISEVYMITTQYSVAIKPCEVINKMKIVSYPDKMTYYDGYVMQTKNFSGLECELEYTDGKTVMYSYDENEEIVGTTVHVGIEKDENGQYYIYVTADFAYARIYIDVIENPVESISVYSASKVECFENMSGYKEYDEDSGEVYFVYRYSLPEDLMMQINYTDGTSVVTSYYEKYDDMYFEYSDNQHDAHWTVGKNPVTFRYYGKECVFYVDVLESPVEYLTVDKAPSKQYVWSVTGNHAINGSYYEFWPFDISGMELTAHYKDGTTRTFTDKDFKLDGCYIGDYRYYIDTQIAYKKGAHTVTMEYLDNFVTFDVMILGMGDADGDGEVSVMDSTRIQMSVAKAVTMTKEEKKVADVDKDKEVSVMDATKIQRYIAQLEPLT